MTKMLTLRYLLPALLLATGVQVSFAQTACNQNPNAIICDDFESYNLGALSPQSAWWAPWDLNDASIVSADVSSEFVSNGEKAMKIKLEGAGDDQLLLLGNRITGRYDLTWKMYVPVGNAAYFNVQTDETDPGGSNANFSNQVFFRNNGTFDCNIPTPVVSGTYPQGVWFEVSLKMDLDNNLARLYIADNLVRTWIYSQAFGAIDYYASDASHTFYVDEVSFTALPPTNVDLCNGAFGLYTYFGGNPGEPQTTGIFNNTSASAEPADPAVSCWGENSVDNSLWYTFTGDGNKYHIETVPCTASQYIGGQDDPGDTQMLVYAGDDCSNLTPVACNDDLSSLGPPENDWRAGVDLLTESGQDYFMLIDGFNLGGAVATGEFCIEITRLEQINCEQAAVGNYTLSSSFVCFNDQLADQILLDKSGFVIPEEGPVSGMAWALTTSPVPAGAWPLNPVASTPFLNGAFAAPYQNVGPTPPPPAQQGLNFGQYYLTPVVLGGGTIINPNQAPRFQNINPLTGCFRVGASTPIHLLPALNNITASVQTSSGAINLSVAGGLGEWLSDSTLYTYQWSNGATTQDLQGVPAGLYTCTISDISGCANEVVVTTPVTVGTKDPSSVQTFHVQPNPTTGMVNLDLALNAAADVRIEVLNTLGQSLQSQFPGKLLSLTQAIDLSGLADGTYFLRITVNGETAIRRILLQR